MIHITLRSHPGQRENKAYAYAVAGQHLEMDRPLAELAPYQVAAGERSSRTPVLPISISAPAWPNQCLSAASSTSGAMIYSRTFRIGSPPAWQPSRPASHSVIVQDSRPRPRPRRAARALA